MSRTCISSLGITLYHNKNEEKKIKITIELVFFLRQNPVFQKSQREAKFRIFGLNLKNDAYSFWVFFYLGLLGSFYLFHWLVQLCK